MPKRKKKKEDEKLDETEPVEAPAVEVEETAETQPQTEETTEETHPQEEIAPEEPVEETEAIKPSKPKRGMVKVKVLVGTLQFEDGVYKKDEVFEVSKQRAKQFDPTDIKILK